MGWLVVLIALALGSAVVAKGPRPFMGLFQAIASTLIGPIDFAINQLDELRRSLGALFAPLGPRERWIPELRRRALRLLLGGIVYGLYIQVDLFVLQQTLQAEGYPARWALLLALGLILAPLIVEFAVAEARRWYWKALVGVPAGVLVLGILAVLGLQRAIGISSAPTWPIRLGAVEIDLLVLFLHVGLPVLLFMVSILVAPLIREGIGDVIALALYIPMALIYGSLAVSGFGLRLLSLFLQGIFLIVPERVLHLLAFLGRLWWNPVARSPIGKRLGLAPIPEVSEEAPAPALPSRNGYEGEPAVPEDENWLTFD